jgi:hypothetical protein
MKDFLGRDSKDFSHLLSIISENITNAVIHFVNSCYGEPMANKNDNLSDAATVMKAIFQLQQYE